MTLFSSLIVLSIEQATTLPYMTLRLAEEGAQVIRVENPPQGDPNRWVGPEVLPDMKRGSGFERGMNAYFLPNNLGKQSITLNLRTDKGVELLHQLIRELPVDIFATNQRPGSYKRLGIDYETLIENKPNLIWVGITGFGPQSNETAYDPILQARAGFMDLTGEPNGDPMVFGLPMVDLGAGEHAYSQVMKALYRRAMNGEGTKVEISMYQSAISWMVSPVMLFHSFDIISRRHGNTHPFFAPVSVYPTKDGQVYFAVGNDSQWQALMQLPGFETLAREAYKFNAGRIAEMKSLNQEISSITKGWSTVDLVKAFNDIGVPISPISNIVNVCQDALVLQNMVHARDPLTGIDISIPSPPVMTEFLRHSGMMLSFPPRLGEHNETIYSDLGYDVTELQAKGIL